MHSKTTHLEQFLRRQGKGPYLKEGSLLKRPGSGLQAARLQGLRSLEGHCGARRRNYCYATEGTKERTGLKERQTLALMMLTPLAKQDRNNECFLPSSRRNMEGKLSRTAQKITVFIVEMVSVSPTLSTWQFSKSAEPAQVLGTED